MASAVDGSCSERIFKQGKEYKGAGILLCGLTLPEDGSHRLYAEERIAPKLERLDPAIDEINRKFGRDTIHLAVASTGKWKMKTGTRSPLLYDEAF